MWNNDYEAQERQFAESRARGAQRSAQFDAQMRGDTLYEQQRAGNDAYNSEMKRSGFFKTWYKFNGNDADTRRWAESQARGAQRSAQFDAQMRGDTLYKQQRAGNDAYDNEMRRNGFFESWRKF